MMKLSKYLYALSATFFLAACSSDVADIEKPENNPLLEGMTEVHLRLSTADQASTRAWQDGNATDDEMMNIWTVIVTNTSNQVQAVYSGNPTGADREIDIVTELSTGATYKFYSFANISHATLQSLLGINFTMGTTADTNGTYTSASCSGTISSPDAIKTTVNGNSFDPTAADNGLGAKGIPMSNVQTYTITSTGTYDLIVIRMVAKLEIQLFNATNAAVSVQSVTLSDITSNATDNLNLLPSLTAGANSMEYTHQDIKPNLASNASTAEYTYTPASAVTVPANTAYSASGSNYKMTFYVNESATPSNSDKLFYLTLKLSDTEYRYALISNNTANEWNYIARNDYRVIPIVLDDYKLELIPYDFPPIGVLPCSVKELEGDLYEMTFHDYGHFHLLPKVTKTSSSEVVEFSSTTPTSGNAWTLKDNDWTKSWFTAAAKGGTWLTASEITANGFYRNQTATVDADDAGGTPVWYANNSSPQWAPSGTTYRPFIFGYIADPGASLTTDKQIYHEFRIQLYVDGSYRRDMLYRFYMTLSADQMSYARGLHNVRRHSH